MFPCLQEQKRNRRRGRRSSKQAGLLSPDRQDSMTEDGEGKSRSESMLDVARGLSASLQNIRRSDRLHFVASTPPPCHPFPPPDLPPPPPPPTPPPAPTPPPLPPPPLSPLLPQPLLLPLSLPIPSWAESIPCPLLVILLSLCEHVLVVDAWIHLVTTDLCLGYQFALSCSTVCRVIMFSQTPH